MTDWPGPTVSLQRLPIPSLMRLPWPSSGWLGSTDCGARGELPTSESPVPGPKRPTVIHRPAGSPEHAEERVKLKMRY